MSDHGDVFDWEKWSRDNLPPSPELASSKEPIAIDVDGMMDWTYQDPETVDWTAQYEELISGPFGPVWEDLDRAVLQPDR
jgi:hypothetical protein